MNEIPSLWWSRTWHEPIHSAQEQSAPVFEGPASLGADSVDEAAWRLLCMRHPRMMRKTLKALERAEVMHRYYVRKIRRNGGKG